MSKFFGQNIQTNGRIVRAVLGLFLLGGGGFALIEGWWLGLVLLACGGFALFEARRGWCLMRACGIKTRF